MVHYQSIQIARALAAIAVVVVHTGDVAHVLGGPPYAHGLFQFGQAGVDLFFVISGFIIASVTSRTSTTGAFVGRRVIRIVPMYWLFTVLSLAVLLDQERLPSPAQFVASLAILPQAPYPVLGVGWSLEHEIIFYAIAAIVIATGRNSRLFTVMAVIAAVGIALNLAVPQIMARGADRHLFSLYHVEFFIGVAVFRVRDRVAVLPWHRFLIGGMLIFPISAAILHLQYQSTIPSQPYGPLGVLKVIAWGSASALILIGLIGCERQHPSTMRSWPSRQLLLIGDASYILYLSHPLVFKLLIIVGAGWSLSLPSAVGTSLAVMAAVGVAVAFHRMIEVPFLKRMTARSAAEDPRVPVAAPIHR